MKKLFIKISLVAFIVSSFIRCQQTTEKNSRVETLPYYQDAIFTPQWLTANSDELTDFHQISPFKLINQDGDTITEKTFKNKIYVTDFFFSTCPGICPKMTSNMAILQEEFLKDDEVLLLSHSVTPKKDSVGRLKIFAELNEVVSNKWHLATGNKREIYRLGRKDYFVEENLGLKKKPLDFLHTENFVLVDKNKHIRGIYNGLNKNDVQQLIADIKTLKKEF